MRGLAICSSNSIEGEECLTLTHYIHIISISEMKQNAVIQHDMEQRREECGKPQPFQFYPKMLGRILGESSFDHIPQAYELQQLLPDQANH